SSASRRSSAASASTSSPRFSSTLRHASIACLRSARCCSWISAAFVHSVAASSPSTDAAPSSTVRAASSHAPSLPASESSFCSAGSSLTSIRHARASAASARSIAPPRSSWISAISCSVTTWCAGSDELELGVEDDDQLLPPVLLAVDGLEQVRDALAVLVVDDEPLERRYGALPQLAAV